MPSTTNEKYTDAAPHDQVKEEKWQIDGKKQEGSKEGKPPKAAQARKDASNDGEKTGYVKMEKKSKTDCTTQWDDPDHMEDDQREYQKFLESSRKSKSGPQDEHAGKKRGRGANTEAPSKKQKSAGGKHDERIGAAGDKTRVPKKGQKVQWHSLPGYVDGEVVEVVYEEKEVDGKSVKASKEDPRVVLKSDSSGKICVHKPEAVYFD
jgi:hypothetical protein